MNFEEILRQKIAATSSKVAKSILKVVLGEFQQKNAGGKATLAEGYNIVEKVISGNKETLSYLQADDPRRAVLEEETATVSVLLPTYLTADEVFVKINDNSQLLADVKSAKNDGQATGVVVKWCKAQNLDVKGDSVKEAVQKVRQHAT